MEEKKIDFEKELERLNALVSRIQDDSISLDESIKLYEEGNKIIVSLEKELSDAQEKIEKVVTINKK